MRFDLADITDIISDMPDTYHHLSDATRQLSLSLLTFARERWRWKNDGDKLTDIQWDTALGMVDNAIEELIRTMLTGMIVQWTNNSTPAGFLLCDGSAISRDDYADLFGAIGTVYGVGDGSTTFNLPDLRGRVPVGENGATFNAIGDTGGEETHTLSTGEIPQHNHSEVTAVAAVINGGLEAPASAALPGSGNTGNTGGGNAHNNIQPYLVVNHIIKT